MDETNLNVIHDRAPLRGVRSATLRIFANGVEVKYWDDFNWDETMCIRDSILDLLDTFNNLSLQLDADGNLVYCDDDADSDEAVFLPIPDAIANADFECGYNRTSTILRLIGDKIPLRVTSSPGSRDFEGIQTLHILYEPNW